MEILIFHNANCGTSRNVVRTTTDVGYKPEIIKYLETGWSKSHLKSLFTAAGILAKEALRVSNTPAEKMGQSAPEVTQDQLLDAMVAHPILVNRPIVVCKNGAPLPAIWGGFELARSVARCTLPRRRGKPNHRRYWERCAWRLTF